MAPRGLIHVFSSITRNNRCFSCLRVSFPHVWPCHQKMFSAHNEIGLAHMMQGTNAFQHPDAPVRSGYDNCLDD